MCIRDSTQMHLTLGVLAMEYGPNQTARKPVSQVVSRQVSDDTLMRHGPHLSLRQTPTA